ncbi:hypothetical protein AAY473_014070 [Plecturocebus cupreus]
MPHQVPGAKNRNRNNNFSLGTSQGRRESKNPMDASASNSWENPTAGRVPQEISGQMFLRTEHGEKRHLRHRPASASREDGALPALGPCCCQPSPPWDGTRSEWLQHRPSPAPGARRRIRPGREAAHLDHPMGLRPCHPEDER